MLLCFEPFKNIWSCDEKCSQFARLWGGTSYPNLPYKTNSDSQSHSGVSNQGSFEAHCNYHPNKTQQYTSVSYTDSIRKNSFDEASLSTRFG